MLNNYSCSHYTQELHFMNLVIYEIQMNNFEFWDHLNIKFLLGFKIFYVRVYFVQKQFFVQLI
jgi:hypothetical protein